MWAVDVVLIALWAASVIALFMVWPRGPRRR
jgi:hypothetical protein